MTFPIIYYIIILTKERREVVAMRKLNTNEKEMLKGIIEEIREISMFNGRYDAKNGKKILCMVS